jgi:predicted small secreted protein
MNLKIILTPFSLAATSFILTSCVPTPYHNGKEIKVISRRCDTSGCLDKVQYVDGHLPPFEIAPERIEWR